MSRVARHRLWLLLAVGLVVGVLALPWLRARYGWYAPRVLADGSGTLVQLGVAETDLLMPEFQAQVTFGASAPITARCRIRGQSTRDCEQKSYRLEFSGRQTLLHDLVTRRCLLLGLAFDTQGQETALALALLKELGGFPAQHCPLCQRG